MKVLVSIPFLIFIILNAISCSLTKEILLSTEKNSQDQTIEISTSRFKSKGEWFNLIRGAIRNKSGKLIYNYQIVSKCGCLSKTDYTHGEIIHYNAVENMNYDIAIDYTDKSMLFKFGSIPDIENYCSKSLLTSTKGFVRNKKR